MTAGRGLAETASCHARALHARVPHRNAMNLLRSKRLIALLAVLSCGASAPAAGAVVVGIGEGNGTAFWDARFRALNIHHARVQVPWNVMFLRGRSAGIQRSQLQYWLDSARANHIVPLVSFGNNGSYVPTISQYRRAVDAFLHRYPWIKEYTAWNEPDWIYISLSRHPQLAAGYFNVLSRDCRRCTVAAGELYTQASQLRGWLRAYIRGLHYRPKAWAIHNYRDVRGHSTAQLRVLMSMTSGQIWLTENGGILSRGHWEYPNQSAAAANRDEKFMFSLPRRFHRVTRIYHYMFRAYRRGGWDSALIGPRNDVRPAYYTVKAAAHGR